MPDGREEREETRKRLEQEKQQVKPRDREDWRDRTHPDEGAPERHGS